MANTIIPKRSSVSGKVPATTDLQVGELAINLTDGLIYTKNASNQVISIGGGGGLPSQSGNGGKFLTTDGTNPSWATISAATLGLVVGTNVQAWDADLDAIAALSGTAGLLKKTAANTWALDTNTYLTANQTITVSGDASGSGTTAISLTLATVTAAKGGTGQTTYAVGDLLYASATNALSKLTGNTTATKQFLTQTGTGTASVAPSWAALANADIPTTLTGKTYNGLTLTAAATGFTVAGGTTSKTLTVSNTLTLAGTDASTLNIGAGGTLGSAAFTASTAYAPAAGSASVTTLGTVTTGTWNAGIINSTYGGTGVNNAGRTLTINTNSGTLAFSLAATTLTIANTASVSGTNTGDQTITLTGDVTGTGTGSFAATLANSGVTAGTYKSVTVDAKGRVTGGTNPTTLSGYGITDAQPLDADLTAIAALTGTSGFLKTNGAGTWTVDTSTYLTGITSGQVTTALGFTPENAANKGVANGYASLDSGGKVPSTQLPSYVDDVLEYANLAGFPASGSTGIIYVALDTNKIYRWSGTAYIEISGSPGSTDAVTEGTTNLYFTQARARASISVTQNLTYNSTTGVITGPDLSGYLTSATAASTYQTQAGMSSYLTTATAASTYLTIANAASNYQPLDGDLTSIAGLAGTTGFLKKTAANTWALDTSTYLTANQSITLSGDASGSGATSIAVTLANSGVTAGTYTKVTVDAKGRVTVGASLASADLPTYTGTLTSSQVTTALGYTPLSNATSYLALTGGTLSGALTLGSNPAGRVTALNIGGYNADGGTGYHGIASLTNTYASATNPNKFIRMNSTGGLEIVNSAYTAVIFSLADNGDLRGVSLDAAALSVGTVATARLGSGTANSTTYLRGDGTWATVTSSGGTVTSVGLSLPSIFSVTGSPVTSSGTLTATLASQTANTVFAAPNGTAGAPTFRSLVAADIPTLNQNTTGSAGSVTTNSLVSGATNYLLMSGTGGSGSAQTPYTYSTLIYNSLTNTLATNVSGSAASVTNALTAGTGLSGSTYNGSAAVTWSLATSGVTAGTYTKITVDAYGRATAGTTLSSADLPTYTGTLTSTQVTNGLGFTPPKMTQSETAPTSPAPGDLWWNSGTGLLSIYFTDADSSQWVDVASSGLVNGSSGSGGITTGKAAAMSMVFGF